MRPACTRNATVSRQKMVHAVCIRKARVASEGWRASAIQTGRAHSWRCGLARKHVCHVSCNLECGGGRARRQVAARSHLSVPGLLERRRCGILDDDCRRLSRLRRSGCRCRRGRKSRVSRTGRHTYNDDGFGFWLTFLPTSTSPLETPWDLSHTPLTRQHNLKGYKNQDFDT